MYWDDPPLMNWLKQDLEAAKAVPWRFVAFHHPPFNLSSYNHTNDWHMAQIWPILQKGHVDLVFTGHLHTYQRTTPLTITPAPPGVKAAVHCANEANIVPDKVFDGVGHTRANGPIQILTGGGGGFTHPTPLPAPPKPFHGKVVLNKHCFSLLEVDADRVVFKQLGTTGKVLDSFTLTH
jgi:3',5'-cyclic AMP phosphodiesterase CpdA